MALDTSFHGLTSPRHREKVSSRDVTVPRWCSKRPEDLAEHIGTSPAVGHRLVSQPDAVQDHVFGQGEEVFRDDVMPALDQGPRRDALTSAIPARGLEPRSIAGCRRV